jgi:thiamine transport system permease protein
MASRAGKIGAITAACGVGLLIFGSLGFLLPHANIANLTAADIAALRFTLLQTALSAAAACLVAIPLARALFRARFWGKAALIRLISAPFILPSLAAVIGLLAIFGRGGVLNDALAAVGAPQISIFGLGGVVLAHVFLNLPLATRMLLNGWADIPTERFRLAQSLSFGRWAMFVHLEWPLLRALLPSAFAVIFLVCLTSFSVALILGGGPRATTIELGIYQSLRFEFDLSRAANLALMQTALCLIGTLVMAAVWRPSGLGIGLDRKVLLPAARLDGFIIALATLFFALPLAAIATRGMAGLIDLPNGFWMAAGRSIFIAVTSALLATWAALMLAMARARGAGIWAELAAMLPLGTSSLALGVGAFLALRPVMPPQNAALILAIFFNAAIALPFVYRLLLPSCRAVETGYSRLMASLRMSSWAMLRVVFLRRLASILGFSMGLSAAMAMGDFGVIALFGAPDQPTLPILAARLMGAYQMQAAASVTMWLVLIAFSLFWLFDHLGGRDAGA